MTNQAVLTSLLELADVGTVPAATDIESLVVEALDFIRSRRLFADAAEPDFDIARVLASVPDLAAANAALALVLRGHVVASFALTHSRPDCPAKFKALGSIGRGELFGWSSGWGVIVARDTDAGPVREFSGRIILESPVTLLDWVAAPVSDERGSDRVVILPVHRLLDYLDAGRADGDVAGVPVHPGETLVPNTSPERPPGLEAIDSAYRAGVLLGVDGGRAVLHTRYREILAAVAAGEWTRITGDQVGLDRIVAGYAQLHERYLGDRAYAGPAARR